MIRPRCEGTPGLLYTNYAIVRFARIFGIERRDALRSLVKLAARWRIVHRSEGPHGIIVLAPDGARVLFAARALPGLGPLVVVGVDVEPDADEEDEDGREAA